MATKLTKSLVLAAVLFFSQGMLATVASAVCGDGAVDTGEDCDDGDTDFESGEFCGIDCTVVSCGHASGSAGDRPIATDALFALKAVVGIETCESCVCDTDGSGQATATDVLRILAAAVGQPAALECGACVDLVRHGALTLLPVLPVPVDGRDEVLAERQSLESAGFVVAADGSTITWPERAARGWLIRVGESLALSDSEGAFAVTVAEMQPTVGTIAHPQQPEVPLFELRMDQLARLEEAPVEFEFELEFAGACGMNDDPAFPDPPGCDLILGGASAAPEHHHHHHGDADGDPDGDPDGDAPGKAYTDVSAASQTDPQQAREFKALGWYPLGNQNCCRDYDGGDYDPTSAHGVILNYMGSTCSDLVDDGCCAGELGSIKNSVLKSLGLMTPVSCKNNHKGRYCQEVAMGNVSLNAGGPFATPASPAVRGVRLGETVDVTEHNNGCFGITYAKKTLNEIFGVLNGGSLANGEITHFSGTKPNFSYTPDVELEYATPRCVSEITGNERDRYTFSTDGDTATVTFELKTGNLWRCVDNGSIFSGDSSPVTPPTDECPMYHKRGPNPCNDAPDPGGPCGHGEVEPVAFCGDGVIDFGEDCEPGKDAACPGQCSDCDCPGAACGNDVLEAGEECDGDALPVCEGVCTECVCNFCGNGRIDFTEECDGNDLGGKTCESLDLGSGTLACNEFCGFDTSACVSEECGNGVHEGDEECDGADAAGCGVDICDLECFCVAPGCGNGVGEPGEQCDQEDFFCHGGTCLNDCYCDNMCFSDGECSGGDLCMLDRCIAPCMTPGDCAAGEVCTVPGVTLGGEFQPGCSPPLAEGSPVGSFCDSPYDCESFSCYQFTGECTEFCYIGPGGDADCSGGACLEVIPGTNFGFCATECTSDDVCGTGRVCALTADTSDNEYQGYCAVAAGVGALGDACSSNAECDTQLCMTPPPSQSFCSTSNECGPGEVCSPFFICTLPTCTAFCESNDDCGGSLPTCTPTDFLRPGGGDTDVLDFCGP